MLLEVTVTLCALVPLSRHSKSGQCKGTPLSELFSISKQVQRQHNLPQGIIMIEGSGGGCPQPPRKQSIALCWQRKETESQTGIPQVYMCPVGWQEEQDKGDEGAAVK